MVIDAGHGGRDPGAEGKIGKEKDIALAIALKVGNYIEENMKDVEVIYTRKSDVFPTLLERAEIANKAEADLFISIHVNAHDRPSASGTLTLVLGQHRADENFDVAVRENSVILLEDDYETRYEGFDPKSTESYIMFSLMQKTYFKQSIEFGDYVQDQFRDRAGQKRSGSQGAGPDGAGSNSHARGPGGDRVYIQSRGREVSDERLWPRHYRFGYLQGFQAV